MSNALTLEQASVILANLAQYKDTTIGSTGKPYNNVSGRLLAQKLDAGNCEIATAEFDAVCQYMHDSKQFDMQVGSDTVYLNNVHFERVSTTDKETGVITTQTKLLRFDDTQAWYTFKRRVIQDYKFNVANGIANSPALEADMQIVRDRNAAIFNRFELRYVETASIKPKANAMPADLPF